MHPRSQELVVKFQCASSCNVPMCLIVIYLLRNSTGKHWWRLLLKTAVLMSSWIHERGVYRDWLWIRIGREGTSWSPSILQATKAFPQSSSACWEGEVHVKIRWVLFQKTLFSCHELGSQATDEFGIGLQTLNWLQSVLYLTLQGHLPNTSVLVVVTFGTSI